VLLQDKTVEKITRVGDKLYLWNSECFLLDTMQLRPCTLFCT